MNPAAAPATATNIARRRRDGPQQRERAGVDGPLVSTLAAPLVRDPNGRQKHGSERYPAQRHGNRIALLERRNRLRIVALVVLATLNYIVAVVMAAIALGIGLAVALIFQGDAFVDADTFPFFVLGVGVVAAGSAVIGILVGLVRIPFLRRRLEQKVLTETAARVIGADEQTEVKNLLEGLVIASGLPPPRIVVIDDPAPNSFGVGTRPSNTVVGITTGLGDRLSRDELQAVLAYEVSRIRSWDVALSSWAVAPMSSAISAVDDPGDDNFLKAILGVVPRRLAESLQVWALRCQGVERDRAAVQFTRNPSSLIRALELDADASRIRHVSRSPAAVARVFPQALGPLPSPAAQRLARELLLISAPSTSESSPASHAPRHAMMLTPPGPTKRPTTMSTTPQMIWRCTSPPIPRTTRITAMSHRMKFMPPPSRLASD